MWMGPCRPATARTWWAGSPPPSKKPTRRAVEKAGPWKPWKTKSRFSTVPTVPWKSLGGISTFPPLLRFLFLFQEQKQKSPRRQADAGHKRQWANRTDHVLIKPDRLTNYEQREATGHSESTRTEMSWTSYMTLPVFLQNTRTSSMRCSRTLKPRSVRI